MCYIQNFSKSLESLISRIESGQTFSIEVKVKPLNPRACEITKKFYVLRFIEQNHFFEEKEKNFKKIDEVSIGQKITQFPVMCQNVFFSTKEEPRGKFFVSESGALLTSDAQHPTPNGC